jgi:cytochrome c oxidase subunit 1
MNQQIYARDDRFIGPLLVISYSALFFGLLMGLFQALDRMNINLYDAFGLSSYYQGLTLHGVLNVLVFTFAFSAAFLTYVTMRSLKRPMALHALTQAQFWTILVGVILASWKMLDNSSSVLFTFYPPLKGHPLFYLGLVFLVVSTWCTLANIALTVRAWKQDNPGQAVPLQAFISLVTYTMWGIASVGIAAEVLFLILPWAMGWIEYTDPQLARTLFWFSGHPIVYFWLLPVYVSWYTMLPKQVGGKLFSDPLTRLSFLIFLVLSIPVGFHHQFTDPGVPVGWKWVHAVLTFGVFTPSLMTLFSVVAALETGGRARGGKGLFGWIRALPWDNPSVVAQLLAGIGFMLGGITGLVNASYTLNMIIHNTAFVPGHFHLTVGTGVMLSVMGIAYWLVPALTGKKLWGRRIALANSWLWFIGVLTFSRGQIMGGLEHMPRRTWMSAITYYIDTWVEANQMTAIGGTLMFIGGLCFFIAILGTIFLSQEKVEIEMPMADIVTSAEEAPAFITKRLSLWIGIAVTLILISYGPYLVTYLADPWFVAPGFRLW